MFTPENRRTEPSRDPKSFASGSTFSEIPSGIGTGAGSRCASTPSFLDGRGVESDQGALERGRVGGRASSPSVRSVSIYSLVRFLSVWQRHIGKLSELLGKPFDEFGFALRRSPTRPDVSLQAASDRVRRPAAGRRAGNVRRCASSFRMLIVAPAGVTQRYRRVSIRVRREAEFTTQRREVEQRARAASINVFHDMHHRSSEPASI